jgi:hypothetical protein
MQARYSRWLAHDFSTLKQAYAASDGPGRGATFAVRIPTSSADAFPLPGCLKGQAGGRPHKASNAY